MPLQAEERLGAMFGPTVVPSLVGPNWKERLETMAYMQEKVCAPAQTNDEFAIASTELSCIRWSVIDFALYWLQLEEDPNICEAVLIHCMSFFPGWGEKNFQVGTGSFTHAGSALCCCTGEVISIPSAYGIS